MKVRESEKHKEINENKMCEKRKEKKILRFLVEFMTVKWISEAMKTKDVVNNTKNKWI